MSKFGWVLSHNSKQRFILMNKRKLGTPKETEDKSAIHGLIGTVVVALITSIFGYMNARLPLEIPIHATQTAESKIAFTPVLPVIIVATQPPSIYMTQHAVVASALICQSRQPLIFDKGIPADDPCNGQVELDAVVGVWVVTNPEIDGVQYQGKGCLYKYPNGDNVNINAGYMFPLKLDMHKNLPLCPALSQMP